MSIQISTSIELGRPSIGQRRAFGIVLGVLQLCFACGKSEKEPTSSPAGSSAAGGAVDGSAGSAGGVGGSGAGSPVGGTVSDAGATAAGGSEPADTCPAVPDPQFNCPATQPQSTDPCAAGAVCDYDVCADGCTNVSFCPEVGREWSGVASPCGGVCEPPRAEESPWTRASTLLLAKLGGECGMLGSLSFDPSANMLEELPCVIENDEQEGCAHRRQMVCSSDEASLRLDMSVAFREGRGWRGMAEVEVGGVATCQGTYALAL